MLFRSFIFLLLVSRVVGSKSLLSDSAARSYNTHSASEIFGCPKDTIILDFLEISLVLGYFFISE